MLDLSWWLEVKRWLVELVALDRDALHMYFAVGVQLLTVRLTRYRLSDAISLVPLVLLEILNEFVDLYYEIWPSNDRLLQYAASLHDFVNTLIMPVVLLLVARHLRPADSVDGSGSASLHDLEHDQHHDAQDQRLTPP